ncbi:alpha/beta fold hydrolase [Actinoplanes sp. NPDC051851]|uniref:alpha/beta hydrolase family protein n=1 Tax=Actinoplanes sp. NPDC051851 TaxID=3154753 RepID=UPI00342B50E8
MLARLPENTSPPWPVIVFCHGLGGSERGYGGLGDHLAAHGYAVLHPRFADAGAADPRPMLFDPAHWHDRVERVRAVLDGLPGDERFRPDGVIVAGHSFGAYTAQLHLGVNRRPVHPAVIGGVLCSPQGSGDRGLTPNSWDDVRLPLLVVTATDDHGPHGEGLAWRREPYDRSPSAWKHLAVLRGGDHFLDGIMGDRPNLIAELITAFADRVNGDRNASDWLASGPFSDTFDHETS